MYCIKCGRELPDDSRFCQYCGADLGTLVFSVPEEVSITSAEQDTDSTPETISNEISAQNYEGISAPQAREEKLGAESGAAQVPKKSKKRLLLVLPVCCIVLVAVIFLLVREKVTGKDSPSWEGTWVISDATAEEAEHNWFRFDFDKKIVLWNYSYRGTKGQHQYPFVVVDKFTIEMSQNKDINDLTDRFKLNSNGTIERTWFAGTGSTWTLIPKDVPSGGELSTPPQFLETLSEANSEDKETEDVLVTPGIGTSPTEMPPVETTPVVTAPVVAPPAETPTEEVPPAENPQDIATPAPSGDSPTEETAYSFLVNWINNNYNYMLGSDKTYQEIITKENSTVFYEIVFAERVDKILLRQTFWYNAGYNYTSTLWLSPDASTHLSDFFYYENSSDPTPTFNGFSYIYAPSFSEGSTHTFTSYDGDESMVEAYQTASQLMCLDSINFLNYVFYTYAVPAGYYYSAADFGFSSL